VVSASGWTGREVDVPVHRVGSLVCREMASVGTASGAGMAVLGYSACPPARLWPGLSREREIEDSAGRTDLVSCKEGPARNAGLKGVGGKRRRVELVQQVP
jgi:hypothetical protein